MRFKALKDAFISSFIFKINIKYRLILYFLFLVLIPTSIIVITIYNRSVNTINKKIVSSIEKDLKMAGDSIEKKFESAYDFSVSINLNTEIVHILSSEQPKDNISVYNEMIALNKVLENYYHPNPENTSFIPRIYMLGRPEYRQYKFSDKVFDISSIETESWYQNLPEKARYTVVGLSKATIYSNTVNTIKIAKKLFSLPEYQVPFKALLTIDININDFNNLLDYYRPSINSSIYVMDENCSIVINPDASNSGTKTDKEAAIFSTDIKAKEPHGFFIKRIDNRDVLVTFNRIEPLDWTLVSFSPMDDINGELTSFKTTIYIVIMICMGLVLLMSLLLSENVSYPIRKLVKSMASVQNGNFDIQLEYKRNDEFSYLINTYKKMVYEIKELINKLYISEVNKKEAELKLLQAQINPHFLYNTLDSVNWMAMMHNVPDISTMVTSLSDFFRYSLSKGKNIITLADEKRQVESYLAIQKIRFKDMLDYSVAFPREILGYLTVKLILQPIVENAIIHGIEKGPGNGQIIIKAEKDENVIKISISDNGVGADVEDLNSMLEDNKPSRAYGIRNVNERIKQFFGVEYGIRFYHNEPSGVTVKIVIPAVKTLEGYDAKNDHSGR